MNAGTLTSLGLNALSAILILALIAVGLVIIFGIMGVLNLAHGAFVTLGGYTMWLVVTQWGIEFWLGLIVTPIAVGIIGYLTERIIIRHLYKRLIDTLLATWALAIGIREVLKLLFGLSDKNVMNPFPTNINLGVTTYPAYRLFLIAFIIILLTGVYLLFHQTKYGIRLRAIRQNEDAAALNGINKSRVYTSSFALGAGITGLAGATIAPLVVVSPTMGQPYLIKAFLTVILGGSTTILGVLPGSIVIEGFSSLASYWIQPISAETLGLVLVVMIIVAKTPLDKVKEQIWSRFRGEP